MEINMKRFIAGFITLVCIMCMSFSGTELRAEDTQTGFVKPADTDKTDDTIASEDTEASGDTETAGESEAPADTEDPAEAETPAAGDNEDPAEDDDLQSASKPELSSTKLVMEVGTKTRLSVTGNIGKVKWSAKNGDIVKVTKFGKVIARAAGKTFVYAKVDGKTLKCRVVVKEAKYVSIIAVGDNLYHKNLVNSGLQSDGSYNFDRVYSGIKDYISYADVRIINQETVLVSDKSKWSYQPSAFGTPTEVGDAVVKAGFNVITTASNHSLDKGTDGIKSAVKYWKKQAKNGVLMTGMYDSIDDYNNITIGEYNGIKIAFLNYTYGLNGRSLNESNSFMVKLLKEGLIEKEIKAAKKLADVVIVLPHWGEEYHYQPVSSQKNLAQKMANWGADVIIGAHPHVLEPMVTLTASDGRKVPCYYSLGNFCANMPIWNGATCALEGMAELRIKMFDGKISIESAELTPLIIHINSSYTKYVVYRLEDYTEELMKAHCCAGSLSISGLWKLYRGICDGTAKTKNE